METINKFMNTKNINYSNWNNLMKVIEKIEDLECGNYHIIISKRCTNVIYDWDMYNIEVSKITDYDEYFKSSKSYRFVVFDDNKLEATKQAVLDFIEYYNNKN